MGKDEIVTVESNLLNSSCVIEVGYELTINEVDMLDVSTAQIFRVPRLQRPASKYDLHSPHLLSIGPFHYGKKQLQFMENSKSEAVRRMQKRIQRTNSNVSIKSIVEQHILLKESKIRKFYGEYIPFTSIELAWIVTRDACFLYEYFVNYIKVNKNALHISEKQVTWCDYVKKFHDEEVSAFEWKYDAVFDVDLQNPMRERLMTDILLFENQIPLWILKYLLKFQNMGSAEAAKRKVENLMNMLLWRATRHEVFRWKPRLCYNMYSKKHVLEVFYRFMVGTDCQESPYSPPLSQNQGQISCLENYFGSMKIICKCLCNLSMFNFSSKEISSPDMVYPKLPTALELVKGGVKIKAVLFEDIERGVREDPARPMESCSAIQWMRFDGKTSTLYIPQCRVTGELHTVMGSMVAMEVGGGGYGTKPVTQFALLMEELIDNEDDVEVLRNAEVITNFLGSNKQLAELFCLAIGITHVKGCKSIDDVRIRLHKYTRRKYKKLWSEFVSAYFSKPWLLAGFVAVVLLILMTVAQVFCLFFSCS